MVGLGVVLGAVEDVLENSTRTVSVIAAVQCIGAYAQCSMRFSFAACPSRKVPEGVIKLKACTGPATLSHRLIYGALLPFSHRNVPSTYRIFRQHAANTG